MDRGLSGAIEAPSSYFMSSPLVQFPATPAATARAGSPLAQASDVALVVAAAREADALNLAPTSSTTGVLALGDALAAVTSELKGFTAADFGFRHPAGALGKKTTGGGAG